MIALDTSSFIAYLQGRSGQDVEALDQALELNQAVLPPVVLAEILSSSGLETEIGDLVRQLPMLEIGDGFWGRAGMLRATILDLGLKAGLADTLISQSCLDNQTPLITRDKDFRHFAEHADLVLV